MLHLLGAFAECEREIMRERIKAGIAHARAKGRCVGRRPLLDPDLLETIGQLKVQGRSRRQIAMAVQRSKSFVYKTLRNPQTQTPATST